MPIVSSTFEKGRPLLRPIDLAKFLRHRYVDPGSTFEPESAAEEESTPPKGKIAPVRVLAPERTLRR